MVNSPPAARAPQVIVVEDDGAVRESLRFTMEMHGLAVVTCAVGEDLMRLELPPSGACLVVDERLPGLGGLDCISALRARGVELPAALITSNPQPPLRAAAAQAGVPIIEKPLLGDALMTWVRGALDR